MDGDMRTAEISATELFDSGRWRVEFFTDDNAHNIGSKWPSVRIADIVEESAAAIAPDDFPVDEFYYIGLENVESVTGDAVTLHPRGRGEIKSRSKVVCENYVLYGRLRPYLRKVFWAEGEYSAGLCSTEFIVLKPDPKKVLPSVLRAMLASEAIARQLARLQIGAALPRISASDFFQTSIPLPPMKVQEEIARKLHALRVERLCLKARMVENPAEIDQIITDLALT
jgi:type I restriction enzyme S subunit